MARMVTIQKNGMSKTVSESAFRNFFKDSGWVVAGDYSPALPVEEEKVEEVAVEETVVENEVNEPEQQVNDVEEEIADEEWEDAIAEEDVEKPLSEMTRAELVEKAKELGIEVSKKNNKQLRDEIKAKM